MSRIKSDLTNYLGIEKNIDFRGQQDKVFSIISNLYSSKSDISAMTGWLNLPHDAETFQKINDFVSKVKEADQYQHLVVLGIGGSSLGAQALIESLKTSLWNRLSATKRKGYLTVDFIDNLDPVVVRTILSRLKLDKTLFIVVSKAGGTVETIVPMLIAKEWIGENFYKQCVFITSKDKGVLFELSQKYSVPIFPIPENVGGRYSVFSSVGLLPAALCGVDLNEVRAGLIEADSLCQIQDIRANIAASIALCAYFSYMANRNIFVLMPYSTGMRRFVDWFIQLWAESIGKNQKGSTPICAIGATDQHSQLQLFNEGPNDKLICFVKVHKHKRDLTVPDYSNDNPSFRAYAGHKVGQILNIELDATRRALTESRRPNITITIPELNEFYIAQLMYIFEVSTAIMGNLIGVNPFDQPGVELAKRYTKEALTHN